MNKIILAIFIFSAIIFFFNLEKIEYIFLKDNSNTTNSNSFGPIKKHLVRCNLVREKINKKNVDQERECLYECKIDDIVRVATSISYPCEKYIMEER